MRGAMKASAQYATVILSALLVKGALLLWLTEGQVDEVLQLDSAAFINNYRFWTRGEDVLHSLDYMRPPLSPGYLLWPYATAFGEIRGVWAFNLTTAVTAVVATFHLTRTLGADGRTSAVVVLLALAVFPQSIFWGTDLVAISMALVAVGYARQGRVPRVAVLLAVMAMVSPPYVLATTPVLMFAAGRAGHRTVLFGAVCGMAAYALVIDPAEHHFQPHRVFVDWVHVVAALGMAAYGVKHRVAPWLILIAVMAFTFQHHSSFIQTGYFPINTTAMKAFQFGMYASIAALPLMPRCYQVVIVMLVASLVMYSPIMPERHGHVTYECVQDAIRAAPDEIYDIRAIGVLRIVERHDGFKGLHPDGFHGQDQQLARDFEPTNVSCP